MISNNGKSINSKIPVSVLPLLSVLTVVLIKILYRAEIINILKISTMTLLLSTALVIYIRLQANFSHIKYSKGIICVSYIVSLMLVLLTGNPQNFSFWMIGGLLCAMLVDKTLGLMVYFNMTFILCTINPVGPDVILHYLIIGVLFALLADALKNKATVVYASIILLSTNITLIFIINNFIFDSNRNVNYLASLFSIFAVLVTAFLLSALYDKLCAANLKNSEDFISDEQASITQAEDEIAALNIKAQNVSDNFIIDESANITSDYIRVDNNKTGFNTNNITAIKTQNSNTPDSTDSYITGSNTYDYNSFNIDNGEKNISDLSLVNNLSESILTDKNTTDKNINEPGHEESDSTNPAAAHITTDCKIPINFAKTSYDVLLADDNELLLRMKNYSEQLYNHCRKIGNLSGQAARLIGADENLARAGGYYHEVGKIMGANYIEEGLKLADEYAFPEKLKDIIRQHNIKYDKPTFIESAIVMISDNVITTIEYIEKTGEPKYKTDKIIDDIFRMRLDKGAFDESGLTVKDFKILKEFFQNEFRTNGKTGKEDTN